MIHSNSRYSNRLYSLIVYNHLEYPEEEKYDNEDDERVVNNPK